MGRRWRSGWTTDSAGGGDECERVPLVRCSLMHATRLRMSGRRSLPLQWSLRSLCTSGGLVENVSGAAWATCSPMT
eukprot:3500639-Pyramimonas_sp.AAC.1